MGGGYYIRTRKEVDVHHHWSSPEAASVFVTRAVSMSSQSGLEALTNSILNGSFINSTI